MSEIEGNHIRANHQPSGGKTWMAKITGKHPKFNFNREFVKPTEKRHSSTGKTGVDIFTLENDGYYELEEAWKGRQYFRFENGEIKEISKEEVKV